MTDATCPSGDTLVIRIPFPTTANGVPWKDTTWIEYVAKAALNAGSAYAVGCGAIFDNVDISIDKGQTGSRAAVNDDLLRQCIREIVLETQYAAPLSDENVDRAVQMILEAAGG